MCACAVCVCMCVRVCACVCLCVCACACMCACVCVGVCTHACVCVCVCVCVYLCGVIAMCLTVTIVNSSKEVSYLADHSSEQINLHFTEDGYLTGDMSMDFPPMRCVLLDPFTGYATAIYMYLLSFHSIFVGRCVFHKTQPLHITVNSFIILQNTQVEIKGSITLPVHFVNV